MERTMSIVSGEAYVRVYEVLRGAGRNRESRIGKMTCWADVRENIGGNDIKIDTKFGGVCTKAFHQTYPPTGR